MSDFYQLAALQPAGLCSVQTIPRVHRLLDEWDVRVAQDSVLSLHDTADRAPEVEPISDVEAVLERVIAWPTLGTLDYVGPEGIVTVSYLGNSGPRGLKGVLISAMDRSVDRLNGVKRYQRLGETLHKGLPAKRTIMKWGLETHGFRWQDEVERLQRGLFEGLYPLLDVRAPVEAVE